MRDPQYSRIHALAIHETAHGFGVSELGFKGHSGIVPTLEGAISLSLLRNSGLVH